MRSGTRSGEGDRIVLIFAAMGRSRSDIVHSGDKATALSIISTFVLGTSVWTSRLGVSLRFRFGSGIREAIRSGNRSGEGVLLV